MKLLVIITGEAFRSGGYKSRIRDEPSSIKGQLDASRSQMDFLNKVETDYGTKVDISLTSYKSKFIDSLLEIYKPIVNKS